MFLYIVAHLVTLIFLVYRPPSSLIAYLQRRTPSVVWQGARTTRTIALTIDDGPSASTGAILAVLQAHGARATHFVIGQHAAARPEALRELVAAGHELGNHGMRDEAAYRQPLAALEGDVAATQRLLDDAYSAAAKGQAAPKLFRPGHGWFTADMRARLERLGFKLVLGGIYPHDPQLRFPALNAWHVRTGVRPGSVVILHDRPWTAKTLEILLPKLKADGWEVVTVSELING